MMLNEAQLGEKIRELYQTETFRMEMRDEYSVASDGSDVARYLRGDAEPDPARKGPWLARLRAEAAEGKRRQRVHVWRGPLSGYLLYEAEWGYLPNSEAGEDIRILDLAEQPLPPALALVGGHDWHLIENTTVIRMHYAETGRFAGAEILGEEELPRYRAARDAALQAAVPFTSYWGQHPEYHRRNRAA